MTRTQDDAGRLNVAVVDKFIIFRLHEPGMMLPEGSEVEYLEASFPSVLKGYKILVDLAPWENLPRDTADFLNILAPYHPTILAPAGYPDVDWSFKAQFQVLHVKRALPYLAFVPLDLTSFQTHEYEQRFRQWWTTPPLVDDSPDLTSSMKIVRGRPFIKRKERIQGATRYLRDFIRFNGCNSLLTEFCMQVHGGDLLLTPYHAHAVHVAESAADLVIARPAIIAAKTGTLLRSELLGFQHLLADPEVREPAIDRFLRDHPSILKALGYTNIYPQVVLEREDGTSLRPDYILEPISGEWCDILDIKRPKANVVVGKRDRKMLAAEIHALAAQLREYSAYFENERLAKRVQSHYGIKCYKPKLIGIIGKEPPRVDDERQLRRAMTTYSDLSVLTFDQLLTIAKTRCKGSVGIGRAAWFGKIVPNQEGDAHERRAEWSAQ